MSKAGQTHDDDIALLEDFFDQELVITFDPDRTPNSHGEQP